MLTVHMYGLSIHNQEYKNNLFIIIFTMQLSASIT